MGKWFPKIRKNLISKAEGKVLEIGSGTGVNFPYYEKVDEVIAIEPQSLMREQSLIRARNSHVSINVISASAEEAAPPPVENIVVDAQAAETIYEQSCISCHGGNLEGGVGPNLQQVGGNLTKQQIQKVLLNGRGMMPAFKGKLTDEEITNLVGWLAEHK
jgi:cytochrome c5